MAKFGADYQQEKAIVSFLEVKDNIPSFQKRKFPTFDKARKGILELLNSGRNISNIQIKVNYKVEPLEVIDEH